MPSFAERFGELCTEWGLVTRRELDRRLDHFHRKIVQEVILTAAAQYEEVLSRLATRVGVLTAEISSLQDTVGQKDAALSAVNQQLADTVAGEQATISTEVARQVQEALEADAQRDLARVQEILSQAGGELPTDVPDVPVPDPGQPAEVPSDSDVQPVDESTLPVTDPATGEASTGDSAVSDGSTV